MGGVHLFTGKFFRTFSILHRGRAALRLILLLFFLCPIMPETGFAQPDDLFGTEETFRITISGELAELMADRTSKPEYFHVNLSYSEGNGQEISIPLRVKQRGNFRRLRGNCNFPPLLLNFADKYISNTIFDGQNKIKLVMPCKDDKYVLQEYYAYKLYNLVTPKSFRVRLIEVLLEDPALKAKEKIPFYGFLLEEESQMAKRNDMIPIKRQLLKPEMMQREDFLNMAVFNYLIGNTDWSVQYRQNIKLIAEDTLSLPATVPYDFDHAGIVRAPYAKPAVELRMNSTLQRRYRGFCINNLQQFKPVISRYNSLKEDMYAVYTSSRLLEKKYVKKTIKYLDKFYETINDPKKLRSEFHYPCQKNSTGNIVIRGLKH